MDSKSKGEDLLPRLAPIPRSVSVYGAQGNGQRPGESIPRLFRKMADLVHGAWTGVGRALIVLPVLEVLGLLALVFLLGR